MIDFIPILCLALICSLASVAWQYALTVDGMILGFLREFSAKKMQGTRLNFIHYVLFICPICLAGQIALWLGLFVFFGEILNLVLLVLCALGIATILEHWQESNYAD